MTKEFKCDCGKKQTEKQMRREFDFGYDQSVCNSCGVVMIDNLHGKYYFKPL